MNNVEEKQDKVIVCRNCGKEFTFKVGEQRFYEEKGFAEPVRCKECRDKRKAEREASEEKTQEQKDADLEAMLQKFRENTVLLNDER